VSGHSEAKLRPSYRAAMALLAQARREERTGRVWERCPKTGMSRPYDPTRPRWPGSTLYREILTEDA
jgi:hypothetical protein